MKRSTLILSVLLVLSAAANLAVLGIFAGHWLRGGGPPTGIDRLIALVPGPLRPEIDQIMRTRDDEFKARVEALRNARRNVAETLRQRPFDPAQAETALAGLRSETAHMQEKLHRTIVARMAAAQQAGTLPPPPPERGKGKPDGKPERGEPPPPPPPPPEE